MKREPRYPVTVNGEMLQAIFTRPKPSDTRPFITRLLSSIKLVLRGNCRKGVTFVGVSGKAEF